MDGEPGIDGTPGWAYDEDGYCVCCGNGRWKHHMPDCQLRDALDAEAIVRDFAAADDVTNEPRGRVPVCVFCDVWCPGDPDPHTESCVYRRAVEWVDVNPTEGEATS